jgi:Kef-type K+ transport system membrane component KefB/mannitol/fructose-specific phosphotransferase system IIA component
MNTLTHDEITFLFLALGLLLGTARFLGEVLQRFGQPAVIGEIMAGVLLGPTFLGQLAPEWFDLLFPSTGGTPYALEGLTTVAIAMFLLVAGLEIDLSAVWRQGRSAMVLSIAGIVGPFAVGFVAAWAAPTLMGADAGADVLIFALFMATALSISALPVIAKTLMDLNLYRTDIGMIIVAAAVFNDLVGWIIFAVILALIGSGDGGLGIATTIWLTLAFAAATLTVGRWLIHRSLPWIQAHGSWPGGVLGFALTLGMFGAAFTEWVGVHAIFGAFLVGVALGDSAHLRKQTRTTLEQFIGFIFAPLFFGSIGLHIDFIRAFDPFLCAVVFAIAAFGKIGGCVVGARLAGLPPRDGWAIAFGMNARGTMEIILGLLAMQAGLIGERLFVALVVMALGTSMLSGPLMQWVLRRVRPTQFLDYLTEPGFVGHLRAGSRWEAVQELSAAVAKAAGVDAETLAKAVWQREQLMPTGLVNRVAVPNARVAGLTQSVAALGLSRRGIDFDAPDGQTAQIVCLVLVPENDSGAQWKIFSDVSALFADVTFRDQALHVSGFTEMRALLKLAHQSRTDGDLERERPRQGCILVGASPLARACARRLADLGTPVWIVDSNRTSVEAALREGLVAVVGNAFRDVTLTQVHAFEARALVALTPNAVSNAEIARFAHEEFSVPETWVAGGDEGSPPAEDWIHVLLLTTQHLRRDWRDAVAKGSEQWERVAIDAPVELSADWAAENTGHGAMLPLLVERGANEKPVPAWRGMTLEVGDTVHGLVIPAADSGDTPVDRARRILERAPILDVAEALTADELYDKVAESLSVRLQLGADELVGLFRERQRVQNVAITPDVAIPHLLLEGRGVFELVICRVARGVAFESEQRRPLAVFVLASTLDQRNLHLQTLAAVAGIAQRPNFAAQWLQPADGESLRTWLVAGL